MITDTESFAKRLAQSECSVIESCIRLLTQRNRIKVDYLENIKKLGISCVNIYGGVTDFCVLFS